MAEFKKNGRCLISSPSSLRFTVPEKADFPYPIYDAHHHFWDMQAVHYPWLATEGVVRFFGDPAPIQKDYLSAELRADIGLLPVEKSVHIQVGADDDQHLLEAQTIQNEADESGLANAIIAFCALESSERHNALNELQKLPNLRGIRQIIGRSPEEDQLTGTDSILDDLNWLEGLRDLESRGLSFDLQLIPDQMQRAAAVLSKVPKLRVALCHCGSPWYRDGSGWQMWLDGLNALASLPNVHCKISGLSMFDHDWTTASLQAIVEAVLESFGPERCMFGSNFPVDKLHTSYRRLWMAYLEIVESLDMLSDKQRVALFSSNCADFYRI